jgi:hypothetical protein
VQRKPLSDITEKFRTPKEERVFGVRNLPMYVKAEREPNSHHDLSSKYVQTTTVKEEEEEEYKTLPLVPVKTYRQETDDDFKPLSSMNNLLISTEKDIDEKSDRNSRKNGRKKQKEHDSDTDSSSDHASYISQKSNKNTKNIPSLYSMLHEMETAPEFTESLTNLKLLLKRSDLIEVKPPRYESDLGRRRDVRYGDYFHDKFSGKAIKLKRYLQKLLQYSAQVANDELTRADIIADGPGLSDGCLTQLENASRVPLPGFTDTYDETPRAQKQRVLDLLLTYVNLFYQEEPNVALNDLRLEGPMLTGLLDLYHQLNKGSTILPSKLIEECLSRSILKETNGQGTSLIGNFQGQLRFHKRMEPGWEKNEAKHRRLLFNCCSELTTEAKSVPITSNLSTNTSNNSFRGGGNGNVKRENRTEHSVNEAHVSWDDEYELYEEYAALAITTPWVDNKPRYGDRQKSYGNRDGQNNGNREAKEAYITKVFCTAPCACCGSSKHAMLSPIRSAEGKAQTSEYICPVAMCDNWNEAKKTKPVKLRFAPCPKKFAAACKNDTNLANAALKDYIERGSGKFRDPKEREVFSDEVMKACKSTPKTGGGTRVVDDVIRV